MATWEYVWEILINFTESLLLLIFIETNLKAKTYYSNNITWIFKLLYIAFDSAIVDFFNFTNTNSLLKLIIGSVSIMAFTFIFYDNSIFKKISYSFIFIFILLISDIVPMFISTALFNIDLQAVLIGGILRVPATLIYILAVCFFIFLFRLIRLENAYVSPTKKILYVFYCIIGYVFCLYTSNFTIKSALLYNNKSLTNNLLLISSFYSILMLLLFTYIYNLSCERERNQKLVEEKQQLIMEEAEYQKLLELTASLRQFKHDVQHHLDAIKYISHNGSSSELDEYIYIFNGEIEATHKFISSGNMAIDSILTSKIPLAEAKGIRVTYALSIPDEFSINPVSITTILGNLWNNAIEACEQFQMGSNGAQAGSIDFYIKPIQNMVLISIENTFSGNVCVNSDGKYLSTKKDNKSHGFGLQRVIDITMTNDGFIDISNNNTMFCVHIMFPIKGEPI